METTKLALVIAMSSGKQEKTKKSTWNLVGWLTGDKSKWTGAISLPFVWQRESAKTSKLLSFFVYF
jgi:hypothetical protein